MNFRYLSIQDNPSLQLERLLKSNVIGTPGLSMLYQHLGVEQKLYTIAKPHFITIARNDVVIGTCCFCEREFREGLGLYVRYFAFKEGYRLKGAPHTKGHAKTSGIRTEIKDLLSSNVLLKKTYPFFHYAYVDPRNPRSSNICKEFGFIPIRQYTTQLFSRIFPQAHTTLNMKQLPASSERIRSLLTTCYAAYNHFSFENLNKTYYYVEDENGEIVAGVQVNPDAWRVLTLPGTYGKLLLSLFDRMPFFSRLLSRHFKFLAVEGMYCQQGQEKVFEQLLEKLLHQHHLHTAIMVVDTNSPLYTLTQKIKLGLLAKLSPKVYGNVIARFQGLSEAFIQKQKSAPSYISVHDVS